MASKRRGSSVTVHDILWAAIVALMVVVYLLVLTLGTSAARAQTPTTVAVTGHAGDASNNTFAGIDIQFQLANCGNNQPRVFGYFGIAKQVADFVPDATTGAITGQIWPNDRINCGGVTGGTYYLVTYNYVNVPQGPSQCFVVLSSQNPFNLDTAIPCATLPGPPGPTPPIDVTYHNLTLTGFLAATAAQFTGQVEVGSLLLDAPPSPCPSGQFVTGITNVVGINCSTPSYPSAPVASVFGRVGLVVAQSGDYTCGQVTGCPTSIPVTSVFGRAGGGVTAQTGDYSCAQVTGAICSVAMFATQTDVTGSRSLSTVFQNTGTSPRWVSGYLVVSGGSGDSQVNCFVGPSSSPTDLPYSDAMSGTVSGEHKSFGCMIPAAYYYKITGTNLLTSVGKWYETQ